MTRDCRSWIAVPRESGRRASAGECERDDATGEPYPARREGGREASETRERIGALQRLDDARETHGT
jgi:hypothetical protein